MKLRVLFNTGYPSQPVNGIELEADGYFKDSRDGSLSVTRLIDGRPHELVVYADGVWRSIVDVGAFNAAVAEAKPPPEPARENTRRNEKARPVPAP